LPTVPELPIAAILSDVVTTVRGGAVVVTAPPGSGKTTLVPAAVLDDLPPPGRVVLLQPRRLAARAVAHRIARLRSSALGEEVGYQVRFDSKVGRDTRLVVETTGIMLRRLVADITLPGIAAVVLDEFHERSLEMDLVLGLLVRLRETVRPDLRIVVMSATLAAEPVARLLGPECRGADLQSALPGSDNRGAELKSASDQPSAEADPAALVSPIFSAISPSSLGRTDSPPAACPVIHAEGRVFPVELRYLRHGDRRDQVELVAEAVPSALKATTGHVLVFLPGVGEIRRCQDAVGPLAERQGHAVLPLYGDLPPEAQDRVLDEIGCRKVILATNVAETSLTIPGVTAVIDAGLARQSRVSPATGLPTRTSQGDLFLALRSSHGEFPRIVMAPHTPEEAFLCAGRAFNLAEKYQTLVVVLFDEYLATSVRSADVEDFMLDRIPIERGKLLSAEELDRLDGYRRFAITEYGISPRALPGSGPKAASPTTGDEHDEEGHITEDAGISAGGARRHAGALSLRPQAGRRHLCRVGLDLRRHPRGGGSPQRRWHLGQHGAFRRPLAFPSRTRPQGAGRRATPRGCRGERARPVCLSAACRDRHPGRPSDTQV